MLYLNIVISIVLVIAALIKKNSKITFYVLLTWMWILFAFNNANADYEMYRTFYENGDNYIAFQNIEPIFKQLFILGNQCNISYDVFIAIYSLIGLIILSFAIRNLTQNYSFTLACYFLFPFFIDMVQIRHFMGMAIMTFAFKYLVSGKKSDIVKYYLLNIIAIGFHSSTQIYLILPIVQLLSTKKLVAGILAINITLIICAKLNILPGLIAKIVTGEKYELYFSGTQWQNGMNAIILFGIVQLVSVLIMYGVKKIWDLQKKENIDNINKEELAVKEKKFDIILKSNIALLVIVPFYYYLVELTRIFRMILLGNYAIIGETITKKSIYNNLYIKILAIVLILILFVFLILYVGILDKTVVKILSNNYLINNLIFK